MPNKIILHFPKILNLLLILVFLLITGTLTLAIDGPATGETGLTTITVDISANNQYILVTNDAYDGLVLIDQETGQNTVVTQGNNAGYYATISPNNQYVCFKAFKSNQDGFLQRAMLYEIGKNKTIALTEWATQVGTPAVAPDGTIAVTQGNKLLFFNKELKKTAETVLGRYVNQISFSPDGTKVAFSNEKQQVMIFDRSTQQKTILTRNATGFWGPKFSPQGDKILVSTLRGEVGYTSVNTGKVAIVGKGEALGWVNNETLAYLERKIDEKSARVTQSTLILFNQRNNLQNRITVQQGDAQVALKGVNTAIIRSDTIESGDVSQKYFLIKQKIGSPAILKQIKPSSQNETEISPKQNLSSAATPIASDALVKSVVSQTSRVYLSGVPYIHQVYDTPNNFNGNSACGATSALMAIQYYSVLGTHPITVSVPYSHTSNYGWYVCNSYTKGRTFNIYTQDPSGNSFAGGFGYITQNNWADTKTHMAEYIRYHGRSSSVDWSPSWSKLQTDIANNHPFVVLTSLTSSGHYITAIGYLKNQHTAIFNDPYGDKNDGYRNYNGSFSYYDWPGYNNGYKNLNTVHCFIYCR